jgi:hypothetical protein
MSITDEAKEIVLGARRQDYGDIQESFQRIAGMWSAYLDKHIDSLDVAKMMILLKVSRAKNNNHRDSFVDIVGYVECAEQLMNSNEYV